MEAIKNKDRKRLVSAAVGRIPCDLTITNVQLVNVITGEIYPAEVDILDGVVVRTRTDEYKAQLPSKEVFDGGGRYLVPGCFDTHLHIESTLMTPSRFGKTVIKCGTTAVVHDPHEIGNVMGVKGVKAMLENGKHSPVRTYCLAPTCVPSVKGVESSGAYFSADEINELLDEENLLGLAEVMDYYGVMDNSPVMRGILDAGLARDAYIQGHLPVLMGDPIAAYKVGGIQSCHESLSGKAVREKLRAGMHVNLRCVFADGTMDELLSGIEGMKFTDNVSVCTDDLHAKDILENGHINRNIKKIIASGVDPVTAYRFASYNGAKQYGFDDLGAVAPGYAADMQLLDELDGRNPRCVFVGGKLVVSDFELIGYKDEVPMACEHTVNIPQIKSVDDLRLKTPVENGTAVVGILKNKYGIFDEFVYEELPVRDGYVDISGRDDLCYLAVINRYGNGKTTVTLRKDFALKEGAAASTVSHDSHNLTVAYKTAEDGYTAVRELERVGGGYTAVKDGAVLHTLALPIAGLMSELDAQTSAASVEETEKAFAVVCGGESSILHRITLMCLPCIPSVVVTDYGVYDADNGKFLPQFK